MKKVFVVVDHPSSFVVLRSCYYLSIPSVALWVEKESYDTQPELLAVLCKSILTMPYTEFTPSKFIDLILTNYASHVYWHDMPREARDLLGMTPYKLIPDVVVITDVGEPLMPYEETGESGESGEETGGGGGAGGGFEIEIPSDGGEEEDDEEAALAELTPVISVSEDLGGVPHVVLDVDELGLPEVNALVRLPSFDDRQLVEEEWLGVENPTDDAEEDHGSLWLEKPVEGTTLL